MRKTPKTLRWVKRLLNNPDKKVVFHNAKFDLKMFAQEGIDVLDLGAEIHCTLILSKLWNEQGNHDLRGLGIRYLDRDPGHKDDIKDWLRAQNTRRLVKERGYKLGFDDAPHKLVRDRAVWDVETTIMLFALFYPRVMESCPELYATERDLLRVVIDMESHGVQVDISRAEELRDQALLDIARIKADLDELCCPLTVVKKKKGEAVEVEVEEFNPNSSQLQLPAAFEKLGIKLRYKTKPKKGRKGKAASGGGRWSFDEYSMVRYVAKPLARVIRDSGEEGWSADRFYRRVHAVVAKHKLPSRELLPPLVLKYRELTKMVSTYYNHIIEDAVDVRVLPNGRKIGTLHCSFNQSEAMTGRFSCSQPNLQNMPRIMGPRECFMPRKGRRNWHLDYDQVEMKFFVHFAEDPKMAAAIADDIHKHTAANVYHLPLEQITSERRKRAKAINFGIIYGAGPRTIVETLTKRGLPTSQRDGALLVAAYHRAYPSVRRVTNRLKSELIQRGYITNPYGRRYHIPPRYGYKALNYFCQGTSADLMKRAMVAIWKWLRREGLRSRIIKTVHDEIVLECPRAEEERVVTMAKKLMEDTTSFFVPMTVSAEVVNRRWSTKIKAQELGLSWAA